MGHGSGLLRGALLAIAAWVALSGCGGGSTETAGARSAADEEAPRERHEGTKMAASAEIGALDEGKVTQTFQGAMAELKRCLSAGASRNEFEGGDIAFFVKVDTDGRAVHAHVERSTLGDRETEKCMLKALRRQTWPRPQGGDVGLARNSFGFDMPNDTRPPTDWDSGRVSETVATLSTKLDKCKHGANGEFTATVYVDPDGAATSAGIASSDESGEGAADCLAGVLKDAKYPSPGSWTAKVTFPL
jgi:hypothetical protein